MSLPPLLLPRFSLWVNFDPLNPTLLRDPKLATLTVTEHTAKRIEVHQACLVCALKHVREAVRTCCRPIPLRERLDYFGLVQGSCP